MRTRPRGRGKLQMMFEVLLASATIASAAATPNVLLFFPDELRYDFGGLHNNPYYGSRAELPLFTPHFDEIAKAGTRFTRAFVGAPVCAPSRACLASGRQYDENTVPMNFHNDFDANVTTFYTLLRDEGGYHTMVTGRDDLDKSSGGPGDSGMKHTSKLGFSDSVRCDGSTDVTSGGVPHEPYGEYLAARPFDCAAAKVNCTLYNVSDMFALKAARFHQINKEHMQGNRYAITVPQPLNGELYQDNWIGAQALALLKRRPMGKPFFLEVSHQAPHPPMDVTLDMINSNNLRGRTFPAPSLNNASLQPLSAASVQVGRQNYAAKIERLDYWLGQYLALLEAQGARADTVVCIASDHGEMLFDRGCTAKSRPWSAASSVPLICSGPNIVKNAVRTMAVSTVDLGPTFLDIAGLLSKAPQGMSKMSLLPVLEGNAAAPKRKTVSFGLNNFRGVLQTINKTHTLKFFCCSNESSTGGCPGSTPADGAGFAAGESEYHLYNIAADRFELPQNDLRKAFPDIVQRMNKLLPPPHHTAPAANSKHGNQGFGYRWSGCTIKTDDDYLGSSGARSAYLPLLFIDDALFEAGSVHGGMSLRVQTPSVDRVVINQTKPWESWAIGAYNHAMKFGPNDYRIYYACIEYDEKTVAGAPFGSMADRLCLARSTDGVQFTKPDLGQTNSNRTGGHPFPSNIMAWCYEVSVFEDLHPDTKPSARYKMLCSKDVYASSNGLNWTKTGESAHMTHADDTMDTGWFDPKLGKYVIYVRRDVAQRKEGRNCTGKYTTVKNTCRFIGRCTTTNLSHWEQGNPGGCPPAFGPDEEDPEGIDLYTSGFAPYQGVQLFFPAAMHTFGHSFPWGYGNDGILDVRFAASRDGKTISYVPGAANAREPWFELGLNRCGAHASAPDSYRGGWCDPASAEQMSATDPHTTTNYMVGGLMESPSGEEVFMYVASPGAMGHGEIFNTPPIEPVKKVPSVRPQLGNNSAITLLRIRKHGFVAVEGPSRRLVPLENTTGCRPKGYPSAAGKAALYPGFTTVALDVPSDCNGSVVLVVNAKTSVAGFVQIGMDLANVTVGSAPYARYRLCNSDPLRGNFLAATASWSGGSVRALTTSGGWGGQQVHLEVILVAAKLFSLQFQCSNDTRLKTDDDSGSAGIALQLLNTSIGTKRDAACLDGSPAGFYVKRNTSSTLWIVSLQGGDWCYSGLDCLRRSGSKLGSLKPWPATQGVPQGVASSDCELNPAFCSANVADLNYCDGNSFASYRDGDVDVLPELERRAAQGSDGSAGSGDYVCQSGGLQAGSDVINATLLPSLAAAEAKCSALPACTALTYELSTNKYYFKSSFAGNDDSTWRMCWRKDKVPKLRMRGRANLLASLDTLSESIGLSDATDFLLTGSSAGRLFSFLHGDFVRKYRKSAAPSLKRYKVMPDSGFFLNQLSFGAGGELTVNTLKSDDGKAIPNADPTGVKDSSAALNAYLRGLCKGCDAAFCADAVLDLDGGVYRMAAPLAIDSTVACEGKIRIRGGTLLADAALAKHGNSSFLVTILDHWNSGGMSIDAVTFQSNGTGGGLRVDSAGHTHVTDSTFLNFATVGIWGSKLLPGSGHDLSVDRCTLTECTKKMEQCADIKHKKATAILMDFPDSHVRNTVITCGLRGIVSRAGANDFRGLHIWTSCTGPAARSSNTTVAFADEAGGSRISDCYFDNADLVVSGYRGSIISNSYFNAGANLILKPPTKAPQGNVNLTDPQCQYWKGAVCALTVTGNQFLCGATCKAHTGGTLCPSQCATIDTSQYAIPAAADVHLENNAFEGKAPDASVCTRAARHGCAGVADCKKLFTTCPKTESTRVA